jgi:hypothetical protein
VAQDRLLGSCLFGHEYDEKGSSRQPAECARSLSRSSICSRRDIHHAIHRGTRELKAGPSIDHLTVHN